MCLIIHNPEGRTIPADIIDIALFTNADGFGIFYHDTGVIKRTMDADVAAKLCATDRPFTAHFRYATSGATGKKQCHPFKINSRFSLMQNGTIERLRSTKHVDTAVLAQTLDNIPQAHWQDILETHPCRFAVCDSDTGEVLIANRDLWTEYDGCLYSKPDAVEEYLDMIHPPLTPKRYGTTTPSKLRGSTTDYVWPRDAWDDGDTDNYYGYNQFEEDESIAPTEPKTHTVAVYGTLKQGHGNHDHHLWDAYYLGSGVTADPYPLVVNGLPYLLDVKGKGHNVEVEVYEVSNKELAQLDRLEGHPNWYRRVTIPIRLDSNPKKTITAWVYLMPNLQYDTGVYQSSY